jgi:hypothetical protein
MGLLAVSACAAPTTPPGPDASADGGGPWFNEHWLDCGDGGRLYCTPDGEPLVWGPPPPPLEGCGPRNVHPDPTVRILVTDAATPLCPDGYAFWCQMEPVCP